MTCRSGEPPAKTSSDRWPMTFGVSQGKAQLPQSCGQSIAYRFSPRSSQSSAGTASEPRQIVPSGPAPMIASGASTASPKKATWPSVSR